MQPAYRLYAELQWLPRPPQDFLKQLDALKDSRCASGIDLKSLASHALNRSQLLRLASVIDSLRHAGRSLDPLVPFRLAILSNSTTNLIGPAVVASGARHGIAIEIIQSHFDQVAQEALAAESKLNSSKPNAVLLALDYHALPLTLSLGDAEKSSATVQDALGYLQFIRSGLRSFNSNAICIFQTLAAPAEQLFGSLDRVLPGTLRNLIDDFNRKLVVSIRNSGDVLLDVATLAETVGLSEWHNASLWNLGRIPFSDDLIPLYSDHVARIAAAINGKSRKVLILDLDNVLWGGTIGDDGMSGIRVGQGDPRGEAHLAVQRLALDLRKRGIVLAVSSKNTDDIARLPFKEHPEMLMRLEHFAVFQANWQDKATNIQAIADELALGLDSMVFLDDNPTERGLVRKLLPQLAVPELPNDPALYARTLTAAGYFETSAFTAEDLQRADSYQHDAKRANLRQQIVGVDGYLTSLDMTITVQPFDAVGRARVVQLINRSNQYNLTTRRYTYPEIEEIEKAHDVLTLQVRLADIFGDSGMISVVICRPQGPNTWAIDTWLMSCRVLGRRVEYMVLREILRHAKSRGIIKLCGTYLPTNANMLAADHYAKLGFSQVEAREGGVTCWERLVAAPQPEGASIKVMSFGFLQTP